MAAPPSEVTDEEFERLAATFTRLCGVSAQHPLQRRDLAGLSIGYFTQKLPWGIGVGIFALDGDRLLFECDALRAGDDAEVQLEDLANRLLLQLYEATLAARKRPTEDQISNVLSRMLAID